MSFENPKARTTDGRTFTSWTRNDLALLRKLHRDLPDAKVARALGKTLKATRSRACRLGLKKSKRYLTKMGQKNRKLRKHWPKRYRTS